MNTKWEEDFFKSNTLDEESGNLIKAKKIWVPPSGKRKGYYREDPRNKKVDKKEKEKSDNPRRARIKVGQSIKKDGYKINGEKPKKQASYKTGDYVAWTNPHENKYVAVGKVSVKTHPDGTKTYHPSSIVGPGYTGGAFMWTIDKLNLGKVSKKYYNSVKKMMSK